MYFKSVSHYYNICGETKYPGTVFLTWRGVFCPSGASQVVLVVKNLPANVGDIRDIRDAGSTPRLGRCPGGGHGNPPQYSCLENPMVRGAWGAAVPWVTKSQTWLKWLGTCIHRVTRQNTKCSVQVALYLYKCLYLAALGLSFIMRDLWLQCTDFLGASCEPQSTWA